MLSFGVELAGPIATRRLDLYSGQMGAQPSIHPQKLILTIQANLVVLGP